MGKASSFASLKPRLLATKGAARPAMRVGNGGDLETLAASQNALGWNDMGDCPQKASTDKGHKAAFTLRLDAERHLRLRLASTIQNRSAQRLVTEALDRFLEDIPQLDKLAHQAGQSASQA